MRKLLVGLMLVAGAVVAPIPSGADAAAPRAEAAHPLRLATFNIRSDRTVSQFADAVEAIRPRADVIGLQEIGMPAKNTYLQQNSDWGYYRPPMFMQNPVIWKRELFDLRGVDAVKIADARSLGNEGSNGNNAKQDQYATVVRLTDRATGRTFSVINIHFINGAVKAGQPTPGKPKLFKLLCDQVAGTVRAIQVEQTRSDDVYVMGDFNVGFKADLKHRNAKLPYRQFTKVGLRSMWQGTPYVNSPKGTHNDALIDQIWTASAPAQVSIGRDIKISDHFPALATFDLPAPAEGYAPPIGSIAFEKSAISAAECDEKWQHPTFHIPLTGDLSVGYVRDVVLNFDSVTRSDIREVDTSDLYDNDPATRDLRIEMWPNTTPQPDRTFSVTLKDPVNTTLGQSTVTLTVVDDDDRGAPNCKAP